MDNGTASKHPFWSLTTEALNTSTPPAIPAEHGDRCACRHCASQSYANELHRNDLLQQECSKLRERLFKAGFERDVERYRYLTLVIEKAVKEGDRETWAGAVAERMSFGAAVSQAADVCSHDLVEVLRYCCGCYGWD